MSISGVNLSNKNIIFSGYNSLLATRDAWIHDKTTGLVAKSFICVTAFSLSIPQLILGTVELVVRLAARFFLYMATLCIKAKSLDAFYEKYFYKCEEALSFALNNILRSVTRPKTSGEMATEFIQEAIATLFAPTPEKIKSLVIKVRALPRPAQQALSRELVSKATKFMGVPDKEEQLLVPFAENLSSLMPIIIQVGGFTMDQALLLLPQLTPLLKRGDRVDLSQMLPTIDSLVTLFTRGRPEIKQSFLAFIRAFSGMANNESAQKALASYITENNGSVHPLTLKIYEILHEVTPFVQTVAPLLEEFIEEAFSTNEQMPPSTFRLFFFSGFQSALSSIILGKIGGMQEQVSKTSDPARVAEMFVEQKRLIDVQTALEQDFEKIISDMLQHVTGEDLKQTLLLHVKFIQRISSAFQNLLSTYQADASLQALVPIPIPPQLPCFLQASKGVIDGVVSFVNDLPVTLFTQGLTIQRAMITRDPQEVLGAIRIGVNQLRQQENSFDMAMKLSLRLLEGFINQMAHNLNSETITDEQQLALREAHQAIDTIKSLVTKEVWNDALALLDSALSIDVSIMKTGSDSLNALVNSETELAPKLHALIRDLLGENEEVDHFLMSFFYGSIELSQINPNILQSLVIGLQDKDDGYLASIVDRHIQDDPIAAEHVKKILSIVAAIAERFRLSPTELNALCQTYNSLAAIKANVSMIARPQNRLAIEEAEIPA